MTTVADHKSPERGYLAAAAERDVTAPWLKALLASARDRFAESGLPHRRVEAFKYTDYRSFDRGAYPQSNESVLSADVPEQEGLEVMRLSEALLAKPDLLQSAYDQKLVEPNALADLNLALAEDGLVILVEPGVKVSDPIFLRYRANSTTPFSAFVRNIVLVGKGADVQIVESFKDGGPLALNAVTLVHQAEGSKVLHARSDDGDQDSLVMMLLSSDIGEGAHLESNALSTGGKAARIETQVRFSGENATTALNGLLIGNGTDHVDHTTYVSHDVPNCQANEIFRTILADRAHGVFRARLQSALMPRKQTAA